MAKMLSPDILKNKTLTLQEETEYVEGDDIYKENHDTYPIDYWDAESYRKFIIYNLSNSKYVPEIKTENIPLHSVDITSFASLVEHRYINVTLDWLKEFRNIKISTDDPISDEVREELKNSRYDGISYYAAEDILIIPQAIFSYINNGNILNCKIAMYSMDKAIKNHTGFENPIIIEKPIFTMQYIPEYIEYSTFINEKSGYIEPPISPTPETFYSTYLHEYRNIPLDILSNTVIPYRALSYDVIDKYYYGESNYNQTKLNVLCKQIAVFGLQNPIPLQVLNNGLLVPLNYINHLLCARYLGYNTIPVCIINEPFSGVNYDWAYIPKVNPKIKEYLEPNILINL